MFNSDADVSIKKEASRFDQGLRKFLISVFNHMAIGLGITGVVAYAFAHVPAFMSLLYVLDPAGNAVGYTSLSTVLMFAPLAFVLFFSMGMERYSFQTARSLFYGFSAIMGASLSSLFLVYTDISIARTLFITAGTFAGMAVYGNTTKSDLSSWGSFLMMGLIGLILTSVVNIFMQSPAVYFATSVAGVAIFMGLVAYDMQNIKRIYAHNAASGPELVNKYSIYAAFSLYMNFINLFIYLLRFFGDRRN